MSYFERTGPDAFLATEHTSGAWNISEQHIAPALGLLTHLVETDRSHTGLAITRLSFDILGTVPVGPVTTAVEVVRPGRTIELIEARMAYDGRDVLRLRAWLSEPGDTSAIAATPLPSIPGPEAMQEWPARDVWRGGFIATSEVRRDQEEPGRARFWVRSDVPLLPHDPGEPVGPVARAMRLVDIANGMTVRADPREVLFPNLDLTAHLFATPQGEWVGFDTSVSFGASGAGLTSTVLHDETGPIGTLAQSLVVRPR
ncbi:thioesterase family protein [Nocardioides sp. AE5]|uniref:thioesterase family protein n=1 Tax=Nocardioides sp. AE5 TaxID=2962573 RepID=UPI002880D725|nr:thioesterase family protein [Nocardioides sp. AE5]MDT0200473.1 thioesterase family protein [Nocardioides sp. AE5]